MEGMKDFPDKYFDLAIVDPPYGIGEDGSKGVRTSPSRPNSYHRKPKYKDGGWDNDSPPVEYFLELQRTSRNQIVWGANHFISKIAKDSPCWIVWDKNNLGTDFADCELAWTSFNRTVRKYFGHKFIGTHGGKDCIHPTQKPVQLYKWILHNYAKPDFKIIDTHVGSGSSIIAFLDFGCEWIGFEIDKDYHKAATERIERHKQQLKLY